MLAAGAAGAGVPLTDSPYVAGPWLDGWGINAGPMAAASGNHADEYNKDRAPDEFHRLLLPASLSAAKRF